MIIILTVIFLCFWAATDRVKVVYYQPSLPLSNYFKHTIDLALYDGYRFGILPMNSMESATRLYQSLAALRMFT